MEALSNSPKYQDIRVDLNAEQQILWCTMKPRAASCFTLGLLQDLYRFSLWMEQTYGGQAKQEQQDSIPFRYVILASRMPCNSFNLGGDLHLFAELIRARNREGLRHYAHRCIEALYRIVLHFNLPVTTIALVQGDALGGGLEAALAHDVLIAERGAKLGFPEIHFNLFPGMGAYSFLTRRIGRQQAETMILSGNLYTAEECHGLGIVDIVAEDGKGEEALLGFLHQNARRYQAHQSLVRIRNRVEAITYQELLEVTDLWVETALTLCEGDLRRMERLAATQARKRQRSMDYDLRQLQGLCAVHTQEDRPEEDTACPAGGGCQRG